MTKPKNLAKSKNLIIRAKRFLTFKAKVAFIQFRQAFTKVPIIQHFDLEGHIRTETNASSYTICGVLSQLKLDNWGW